MAKIPQFPPPQVQRRLRGTVQFVADRGIIVAKRWPRKRGKPTNPKIIENNRLFTALAQAAKNITPQDRAGSAAIASGSHQTWRDVISLAMVGRLIDFETENPERDAVPDVQLILNQLCTENGAFPISTNEGWQCLLPGTAGQILTIDPDTLLLRWIDPTPGPEGPAGPEGPTGPQGDPGTPGESGAAGLIPFPGYISGRAYTTASGSGYSTSSIAANTLYAIPLPVLASNTFDALYFRTLSNVAGAQARLGVYTDLNGTPGTLIIDAGAVACATTATYSITSLSIPLTPGVYWLAIGCSHSPNMRGVNAAGNIGWLFGDDPTSGLTAPLTGYSRAWTFASGALPDPFTPTTPLTAAVPLVWIRSA